jgi:hypothetical protein
MQILACVGQGSHADGAWVNAIGAFVSRPLEIRQRAALRLAERYSWDSVVVSLVEALAVASSRA